MAGPVKARGFTLVELLVVITIIGMLMALLLPAIQSAREAGRRNTCSNNVRQVALALANFHDNKRAFPGYANVINNKRASWVVSVLPYMERNDLYQMWQNNGPTIPGGFSFGTTGTQLVNGAMTLPNPWAFTTLNILVCPSNPLSSTSSAPNPLSYVVNCGSDISATDFFPPVGSPPTWVEDPNSGVFFNQARGDWNGATGFNPAPGTLLGGGPKVSMDFISTNDGTSNTLMVSENLQATNWVTDPIADSLGTIAPFQSEFQIKQNTGFVWYVTGNKSNLDSPLPVTTNYNPNAIRINAQSKNVSLPVPISFNSGTTPPVGGSGGLAFSRPSSAHPGGANSIFCDGHLRFIAEDIGYNVYTQLMTTRQNSAIVSLGTPNVTTVGALWNYTLNEADF